MDDGSRVAQSLCLNVMLKSLFFMFLSFLLVSFVYLFISIIKITLLRQSNLGASVLIKLIQRYQATNFKCWSHSFKVQTIFF